MTTFAFPLCGLTYILGPGPEGPLLRDPQPVLHSGGGGEAGEQQAARHGRQHQPHLHTLLQVGHYRSWVFLDLPLRDKNSIQEKLQVETVKFILNSRTPSLPPKPH